MALASGASRKKSPASAAKPQKASPGGKPPKAVKKTVSKAKASAEEPKPQVAKPAKPAAAKAPKAAAPKTTASKPAATPKAKAVKEKAPAAKAKAPAATKEKSPAKREVAPKVAKAAKEPRVLKEPAKKSSAAKPAKSRVHATPRKAAAIESPVPAEPISVVAPEVAERDVFVAPAENRSATGSIQAQAKRREPAFKPFAPRRSSLTPPPLFGAVDDVVPGGGTRPPAHGDAPSDDDYSALDLPLEYGETRVTAMVRDPEWIFAYWEINEAARERHALPRGRHSRPLVLRVHDVTDVVFDGRNSNGWYDVPVTDYTSSWYLRIPRQGRNYVIELGTFADTGSFISLAMSNSIDIPSARLADPEAGHEWREINEEVYAQILKLSGGVEIRDRLSSEDFLRALQERILQNISSGSLFSGLLSSSEENLRRVGALEARTRGRKFWLSVGVDVIVYGATEPDARVSFMGKPIQLTPDGTFRVRMAFPDGAIEFPVEATSSDGVETRRVCPVTHRKTIGSTEIAYINEKG